MPATTTSPGPVSLPLFSELSDRLATVVASSQARPLVVVHFWAQVAGFLGFLPLAPTFLRSISAGNPHPSPLEEPL